jgi:uncharacterized coiled-coil protein SlyX
MRVFLSVICVVLLAAVANPAAAKTLDARLDRLEKLVASQAKTIKVLRAQVKTLREQAAALPAMRKATAGLAARTGALEQKTKFFKLTQKVPAAGAAAKASDLSGPAAVLANGVLTETVTPPNATSPWIAYVWVEGTVQVSGANDSEAHFIIQNTTPSADACQGLSTKHTGNFTWAIDTFCTLNLSPGDAVSVTVDAFNGPGSNIDDGNLVVKTNFVEMVEP